MKLEKRLNRLDKSIKKTQKKVETIEGQRADVSSTLKTMCDERSQIVQALKEQHDKMSKSLDEKLETITNLGVRANPIPGKEND